MGWPTFTATWPTPSATIGDWTIRVRRPVRGQDASGGRLLEYRDEDWSPTAFSVDIKGKSAAEVDEFGRENIVARYEVTIIGRFSPRDQFLWVETGMILTVVAVVAANPVDAKTWVHICEEHG